MDLAVASTPIDSSPRNDRPAVCQVLHSLNVGGAEILAARIARRLCRRFRFTFACLDELGSLGDELRSEGFKVEVIGRRAGTDWRCVRRLAAFMARERIEVVHAHQYTPFFYARAPGAVRRRPPVLFTEHGRFFPDLPSRKRMLFNRWFLRGCDRVVAVGKSVRQALIDNEGISWSRIEVVYNGVELDDFSINECMRRDVRVEIGVAADAPVAILVARLDYLKDHATAIRAAQRVVRHVPDFRLLLIGEGPERPRIEAEIAARGLAGCVTMLGRRSDVRRMLAAADVFLLTSISEGIPVTMIEAMGARLPVVATDVGGVGEVVEPELTGLLAKAGDDAALAEALLRLASNPPLRGLLGQRGRERAEAMFAESDMHARYAAIYHELAQGVSSATAARSNPS